MCLRQQCRGTCRSCENQDRPTEAQKGSRFPSSDGSVKEFESPKQIQRCSTNTGNPKMTTYKKIITSNVFTSTCVG